ncbi:uroporphyrinogen-III C-methyltransferase [Bacillus xiapuensis]|uniref:uroporphyrinogen-III C-methyltransferase n=1 Tax=Bacillus xiapuensis TaxID=2014075 RepID=UPI000C23A667|nr:uroporphyrinogen-III C-methyltransferase [Bacillus xiapuensis]
MKNGKVYLVGAGPGDPKLITVKGLECIQQADVILYDRLVNKELLLSAKEGAELIFCGKLPGRHELIQEQINQLLVEKAEQGLVVTRLKGGDPCVFGRVGEEAKELAERRVPYEIIPGITAGIAAPAYAGIPVTHRDHASSFAIVTAHGRAEKEQDFVNWKALAEGIDTIAFYMGVGNLSRISQQLMAYGRSPSTPVAIIEWGTTNQQRTIIAELATIEQQAKEQQVESPAIILVGNVVELRKSIRWFDSEISIPSLASL